MIPQNKMAQHAIAAMSRLAELYDTNPPQRASAAQIASVRNLPSPVVAKILTMLAQADLVVGTTGPGGGYRLARPPRAISLLQIVNLFERDSGQTACPFGPGWCGHGDPCPMHDSLSRLQTMVDDYLQNTRLDVFTQTKARRTAPAAQSRR